MLNSPARSFHASDVGVTDTVETLSLHMVHPGRNLSRPGGYPLPKEGVADHTIGVVSMSLPIVSLYRPFLASPGVPLFPPAIGPPIDFSSGTIPVFWMKLSLESVFLASSCSVCARSQPTLRPGNYWLTTSCTDRVHKPRSGSSFRSHSSIFLLQKLRISRDMTKFVCRSSAASLANLTRLLSLDTGAS
jgi:hypothetical protein